MSDTPCAWHDGQERIEEMDDDDLYLPGCPNCGRLLETRHCEGCSENFLDFASTVVDDLFAAPRATPDGDLACAGCTRGPFIDDHDPDDDGGFTYV